jgi:hypothetical protein
MGLLDRALKTAGVGTKVDEAAVSKDARQKRHQEMVNVYWWLRGKLDEGVSNFFQTGSYDEIEKVCQGKAREKVKRQLAEYQDNGIVWEMPNRREKTQPQVQVLGEKGRYFTCEERFLDFSVLQLVRDGQVAQESRNNGQPTASNATVAYDDNGHYWFEDFFTLPLTG